ncbi:MAG: DUF4012 domain-containing protein [Methanobacteriaceae archaeon]|nr:MAG: hypothetical protein CIT01_09510 [Methanobacterium sp. BRmetb2]MCC7558416.1 DUF4012 domain-containing protein [Methanobacteriaceae archaeon]
MSRKDVIIIILFILIVGLGFMAYQFNTSAQQNVMQGEHKVLLLAADPSEQRPGIGAIDMAFIITVKDGKIINNTPVYPGGMAHPTEAAPLEVQKQGVSRLLLHDSFWYEDNEKCAKLAQEIVEYNTGEKTDIVVVVTPEAVDALIQAVGPVYIEGSGYINGSSIEFLRSEQDVGGLSRGNAIESVMKAIANASKDKSKYLALIQAAISQYSQGNIVVIPQGAFIQFVMSSGLSGIS